MMETQVEPDFWTLLELAGLLGVAVYLGSYAALQAGFVRGNGYLYTGLNILAASLVLASLASSFNLSSMLIQVSWIGISLFGMARFYLLTRRVRFSDEETGFLDIHFPELPRLTARRFLDSGNWQELPAGTMIARQGEELGCLIHLHSGSARVLVGGRQVADLGPGALVGEMTVLRGGPATADVELTEPARIFRISARALERILSKDSEARMLMEATLARDLGNKLAAANLRGSH